MQAARIEPILEDIKFLQTDVFNAHVEARGGRHASPEGPVSGLGTNADNTGPRRCHDGRV